MVNVSPRLVAFERTTIACGWSQKATITSEVVTDDGFRLGRWMGRTTAHRATLPRHRTLELDATGFDRQVAAIPQTDAKRRRMLTEPAAYRELHGDGYVAWVGEDQRDLLGQLPGWFGAAVS